MNRLLAVVLLALVACGGGDDAARDGEGAVEEAGEVRADRIREGDCFDVPEEEGATFSSFAVVPCDDPHDYEVYELFDIPGSTFPGEEAVAEAAREACLAAYEPFVGAPFEGSAYDVLPVTPTQQTWEEDDDREVVCALFEEGESLAGSQRGAAR